MKKLLIIGLLLLIILLSFGFAILKIQTNGSEENYFNRRLRANFAARPWLRSALGLHWDGDGQADYLGKRYNKVLIEVDIMQGWNIDHQVLDELVQKIQAVLSKPTSYLISDRSIPYQSNLTKEEIAALVRRYRNHQNSRDTATVYLLYASKLKDEPTLLGLTYQEYAIILFGEPLQEFTQSNPKTLANYEVSTALHEFGHQLGLPHNEEPGCLMNKHAEEAHVARQSPKDVIMDFCEFEKTILISE